MDFEFLGSAAPVLGKDGLLPLLGTLLGDANNLVKAAIYFTSEGFNEALANGFVK